MRILIIDPLHFTSPYTENLYTSLKMNNCDVKMFVYLGNQSSLFALCNKNKLKKLSYLLKIVSYPIYLLYLVFVTVFLRPNKVIINIMPFPLIDIIFVRILKFFSVIELILHNTNNFHGEIGSLRNLGYHYYIKAFDRYITHSTKGKLFLESLKIETDRIKYIDFPLVDRIGNTDNNLVRHESNYILFYGIIRPYKGIDIFFEAIKHLKSKNKMNFHVIIAGRWSGNLSGLLKEFLETFEDDELTIKNYFINSEKEEYLLRHAKYLIMPYKDIDGSGILAHGLEYEVPIICSDLESFKSVLGENYPLFFKSGDYISLANILHKAVLDDKLLEMALEKTTEVKKSILKWGENLTNQNYL